MTSSSTRANTKMPVKLKLCDNEKLIVQFLGVLGSESQTHENVVLSCFEFIEILLP